jgi:large subunit ribosomal protein L29
MKGHLEELTNEELCRELDKCKEEIQKARFKTVTGNLENTKSIRENRRKIARILTLQKEYKLGIRTR